MDGRFDIFEDIAKRTDGDIYIGVVGPVRTGKSTFIRRFMELLVIPAIRNVYDRDRTTDELPQGGAGRTIMTSEPKFVPGEAVEIVVGDNIKLRVRMVDCVGYTVPGAIGYEGDEGPRMVVTPWYDHEIPFQEAAELGTRKVIEEHSTIGMVVITDGSITDIPRRSYEGAEERVISELRALGKPFMVVLNTAHPTSKEARELAEELSARYDVTVTPVNCQEMEASDILSLLQKVLYEFPVREIRIHIPRWVKELGPDHWLRSSFSSAALSSVQGVRRIRDVEQAVRALGSEDFVASADLSEMDLGTGTATIVTTSPRELFYKVLEELSGFAIDGDHRLVGLLSDLALAKREYDKVASGIKEVRDRGYGIVPPIMDEIRFEEPELIRQGPRFGVRLKATAPSVHMIRADIKTEVTTVVGTEKQGEELVRHLTDEFEKDPARIWETDFLGKSLYELVQEGIQSKLYRMPENAQVKLQETLQKIINEGSGGLICIIL